MILRIDGQSVKLTSGKDLNKDGKIDKIELLRAQAHDFKPVIQHSDSQQSMLELNRDDLEKNSQSMSSIDLRARLNPVEASAAFCLDSLVAMRFLHPDCLPVSRQHKRLSVSRDGEGRKELVAINQGLHSREADKSFGGAVKNFFGFQQQQK